MSKVDAMRALREARYSTRPAAPVRQRVAAQASPPVKATAVVPTEAVPVSEGLCGHRNMGGKSCTREADHQKAGTKNHRYG